jgi:hypothetical protein
MIGTPCEGNEMLVSHEKRFVYLKCGKTASTSTEAFFQSYCGDTNLRHNVTQISPKGIISHPFHPSPGAQFYAHMPARELKPILGEDQWATYFKFANIRNPFDSVVSEYFDQKPYYKEDLSFESWWRRRRRRDSIWHMIEIDNRSAVDFVIRYENLIEDVGRACQLLDIDFDGDTFPQLRTIERPSVEGQKIPYEEVITSASLRDDIQSVFERTCLEFGYQYSR